MPLDDAATPAAAEPVSLAGQVAPAAAEQRPGLSLTSAVMFVSDLDRSVAFYAELLAWTIAVHELDAALLACPDGGQLYLRDEALEPRTASATSGCSTSSGPRRARTNWTAANGY